MRRRAWPTLLLAAGAAGVAAAGLLVAGDVTRPDGSICGSAWRSARGTVPITGERTAAEVAAVRAECVAAGDDALRGALLAGAAGVVALGAGVTFRRA